jgi:hypothetical protein
MASRSSYSELELDFAEALTASLAPEEVPYFKDLVVASDKPPKTRGDHELGFGVPAVDAGTVTAAMLVLCKPILEFIWDNAKDVAGQLVKDASDQARLQFELALKSWIKRHFNKPAPLEISPDKLETLSETLNSEAKSIGLDEDTTARLIATLKAGLQK